MASTFPGLCPHGDPGNLQLDRLLGLAGRTWRRMNAQPDENGRVIDPYFGEDAFAAMRLERLAALDPIERTLDD